MKYGYPVEGWRCEFVRSYNPKCQSTAYRIRVADKIPTTEFKFAKTCAKAAEDAHYAEMLEKYPDFVNVTTELSRVKLQEVLKHAHSLSYRTQQT